MDYTSLIRRSWQLTWRHRFLWLLGLFATTTVGSCTPFSVGNSIQWRGSFPDFESYYTPDLEQTFQEANSFLSDNVALIFAGVVAAVLLLALLLFIASMIAQGGMAEATADLALGQRQTGSSAWRAGLRIASRYLLMWLLLIGLGIIVAVMLAVAIALVIAIVAALQGPVRLVMVIIGGVFSLLLLLVAIPIFIATSVVVAFAQRAIPQEGVGPWAALRMGYGLLRRNLATSALAWLISLALSIAAGIAIVLGAALLLVPSGALGFALYSSGGVSATLLIYSGVAVVVVIAWVWFLSGVANAFFWNYWTLLYLSLTGRLTPRLEPNARR